MWKKSILQKVSQPQILAKAHFHMQLFDWIRRLYCRSNHLWKISFHGILMTSTHPLQSAKTVHIQMLTIVTVTLDWWLIPRSMFCSLQWSVFYTVKCQENISVSQGFATQSFCQRINTERTADEHECDAVAWRLFKSSSLLLFCQYLAHASDKLNFCVAAARMSWAHKETAVCVLFATNRQCCLLSQEKGIILQQQPQFLFCFYFTSTKVRQLNQTLN